MSAGAAAKLGSLAFADWAEIVRKIRTGDAEAGEQFYDLLVRGALGRIRRRVAPELVEDKLHDVFVSVLEAIRDGSLREPDHLMGFVGVVTRRGVARHIRTRIAARRRLGSVEPVDCPADSSTSPATGVEESEQARSVRLALLRLCHRDREIVRRFYVNEETPASICQAMHLTPTQFRLFKSRAIARCSESVRRQAVRNTHSTRPLRIA